MLYFIGLNFKKATLISLLFTLIYGISIYIIYNKKWNTDLNTNKTYVQGKIYDFDANSEGGGFVAKVRFNFKNEIYESETSYENRKEFKIGDSVEIRFSSIHPNINEVVRDFNK